ncbi:hypothetical protein D3C81_1698350 [compost metagenome]
MRAAVATPKINYIMLLADGKGRLNVPALGRRADRYQSRADHSRSTLSRNHGIPISRTVRMLGHHAICQDN